MNDESTSIKKPSAVYPIVGAIIIQLCVGVAYLWSLFQTGVAKNIFGGDNAKASLTFSVLLLVLTMGSIIGGKLSVKYGVRKVIILGGWILSLGFFLASYVTAEWGWGLWFTYGLLGGLGMGFTYSPTIACAQKWMPHRKGLITGVIVSSLAVGTLAFTPIVEKLLISYGGQGVGEPATFRVLSLIFLIVVTLSGLMIKNPPVATTPEGNDKQNAIDSDSMTPGQVLRSAAFYQLAFSMSLACIPGLMIIAFAKPLAFAKGMEDTATIGVLIISIFNAGGRLFWGAISDSLGRKRTMIILLIGTIIISLLVGAANGWWIFVLIAFIGFFYGGLLGTYPAYTAELFGAKYMAMNYGMVLCGFGLAAMVGLVIAGHYKNLASEDIALMTPAFWIAAGLATCGLFCILLLKKHKAK